MRVTIAVVAVCVVIILGDNLSGFFIKPQDDPEFVTAVAGGQDNSAGGTMEGASPEGKKVFNTICAACHQGSGTGIPGVYPPLAGSAILQGDPAKSIRIVLHGFKGQITRNGKTYNGVMTAFKGQLSDKEIADVLTYARSSWGNSAAAVEEAMVKEIRSKTASHAAQMTEPELDQPM